MPAVPGAHLVLIHAHLALAPFEARFNARARLDDARQFFQRRLLKLHPGHRRRTKVIMVAMPSVLIGGIARWIRSLKRFCRRPAGAVHGTAERGTARRELVQGAAGVAWGGREERWTRECNTPQGRDTCAARTVPPRPPSQCGLRRT